MAETYTDLQIKNLARQIKFNHILDYHNMGYKGKGITILNAEDNSDHMLMTNKVINDYAPEVTLLNGTISGTSSGDVLGETTIVINGERLDFEDAINKYNIKIVTRSYAGFVSRARENYLKDISKRKGVIFLCSAGNDGSQGVRGCWSRDDTAIAIGAAKLLEDCKTIERYYYSAIGEELDFVSFLARGGGTSAASPALACMIALLLQRYGDFNQEECVEILKSLCIDLGTPSDDNYFGWGLPILPLTDKLEALEKIRGDEMTFLDVKDTDWFKSYVDICTDEGLIVGFEDGTFRPNNTITRAEMSAILVRLLEKLN